MNRTSIEKNIRRTLFGLATIIAITEIAGCTGNHGSAYKTVLSANGLPQSQVCVIPLYVKHDGISFGPDGTGGHRYPGYYLRAPYIIDSGENFFKNRLPSKRMFYPFAFGTGYYPPRYLLVKRGYLPLLISDSDVFDEHPITLAVASPVEAERVVAILTAKQPQQDDLYELFHIQDFTYPPKRDLIMDMVHVEFSDNELSLLKSCAINEEFRGIPRISLPRKN